MNRIILSLLALVAYANCDRILVLGESQKIEETHSIYLGGLKDRGHVLTVKPADDASLSLFAHGELSFDHLLILAPGVSAFGGSITPKEIGSFVDAGGNVLVAAGSNIGEAIREIAFEHGFEFAEPGTAVIDHHNYDSVLDSGDHSTIVIGKSQLIGAELITGSSASFKPALFNGVALLAGKTNHLALEIVKAASTAYSGKPNQKATNTKAAGSNILLVGGLQARNNARVVFSGSVDMFSDKSFNSFVSSVNQATGQKGAASGNGALVSAITQWVLKESGVLRVQGVSHSLKGETSPPPEEYTITEEVEYKIKIEELKGGKWVPFQGQDVQLEFVRIDPFVRTTLKNDKKGTLSTVFKLPDVYGVYKFLVDYRRVGYTHLYDVQQVSVRPLWHTQYERFIRSAYPYYVSSFSMMIGLVLFTVAFLYHKDSKKDEGKKKN